MRPENILQTGALAGKLLLESGAEAVRVESTIVHICESFGMEDVNAFATPTGLFISCDQDGKTYAKVIRIRQKGFNLDKINRVNEISRKCSAHQIMLDEAYDALKVVKTTHGYSNGAKTLAAGFGAMFFTYFFGGSGLDGIVSLFIGLIIKTVNIRFDKGKLNDMVKIAILSSLLTILALIFSKLQLVDDIDTVIVGTIMLLVPGVAITNAIRDSIEGDLLSGITRAIEAVLIAVALALGAGVTMTLWLTYVGGM